MFIQDIFLVKVRETLRGKYQIISTEQACFHRSRSVKEASTIIIISCETKSSFFFCEVLHQSSHTHLTYTTLFSGIINARVKIYFLQTMLALEFISYRQCLCLVIPFLQTMPWFLMYGSDFTNSCPKKTVYIIVRHCFGGVYGI